METLIPHCVNTSVIPKAVKEAKTTKEYNRQLALWSIELKLPDPQNIPARPHELIKCDEMSGIERLKLSPEFWQIPAIKNYTAARDSACSANFSTYCWLNNLLDYLEPGIDQVHLIAVKKLRTAYTVWFDANNRWLGTYRPALNQKLFGPDLHESIQIESKKAENEAIVMDLNEMFKE